MDINQDSNLNPTHPHHSSNRAETPKEEANLKLLEERVVVDRHRRKIGEVIVRKVVETHIIEVPVRREKLIVEQVSPDRRQLAAIDLNQGEISGVELTQVTQETQHASMASINDTFIDAKTADRILEEIIENPIYRTAKVKIVFEDVALQSTYEQWLKRRLSEQARSQPSATSR